jgi:hypothetical protein
MLHAGSDTEPCNLVVNGLFKAVKSIKRLFNRLFCTSKLI